MKYTDNLLLVAAGFSLYNLIVVFSLEYFADINLLIPEIFSGRASISLSHTFHQIIGSSITGLLLVRFAAKPVMIALFIAIAINIESYILLLSKFSVKDTLEFYLSNPIEILDLLKPLIILTTLTYLISLFIVPEHHKQAESD